MKTKVIKVPNSSTWNRWFRPLFVKSMEKVIEEWTGKGWKLTSTTPITTRGKTTHYLLTFQKD